MKSTSPLIAIAFVAGLSIGLLAHSGTSAAAPQKDTRAADLASIEKLRQADIAATLTQDPKALTVLWSDNGINLGFPEPVIGIKAMQAAYEKFWSEHSDFKVLKYEPVFKELQIVDGWAIEVGDFTGTYKLTPKDDPVTVHDTGMRLLKRQPDGSWKFALVGMK